VALPDGGVAMVGGGGPTGRVFYAAQLSATGALDATFGAGGISRVALHQAVMPLQLLRQPDGKLLVVASTTGSGEPLVVIRLSADGSLDQSFGSGGVAPVPIAVACDGCSTAALGPDGNLVLTGQTIGGTPAWALTRLTPSGAVDQSFGSTGVITIPGTDAAGYDVAVLSNDDILTLGFENLSAGRNATALITRLTPMGIPEVDYNGGTPAELPAGSGAFAMLVYPDGSAVVGGSTALFRLTSVGAPDSSFGNGGVARVGALPFPLQLLPAAGGAVTVVGPSSGSPSVLNALRVQPDGSVDPSFGGAAGMHFQPSFGGGTAGVLSSVRPRPLPPLAQNSFAAGQVVLRADGSLLAVGGVSVVSPTGEGEGRSIFDFAASALTPGFAADTSFGGAAKRPTLKLSISRQGAASARATHGIRVRLDASAPGLARVTIRVNGRAIAESVLAVFGSGPRTLPVELTKYGNTLLGGGHGVRVSASATVRNLLSATAGATAAGTLR
jgi:uncharacterized delta-60 repeat protein